MTLRFYDSMARALRDFQSLEPGRVRLYTCGPTVYNFAHIGNFRAYVFEDLLRRTLKLAGFDVFQVMNFTDVDDKTIAGAQAAGLPLGVFTRRFKDAFLEDIRILNIEPAEVYPAATEHVAEMVELIRRLVEKGVAYRAGDGSVYFSIEKFPRYGCLAHLDKSGLRPGARVSQDEYEKENLGDFALWKAWDEKDGDVAWDSPWGRGRPGWHIECSAMSMKYLGESFDLHTGGVDNLFPHHEDEIAQSEAATGRTFVNFWLHCAHLVVEGRKMSKSLGNFHTLRDVLARGYSGREVRYELIATHYRQPLDFSFESLDGRRVSLSRLDEFRSRLEQAASGAKPGAAPDWALRGREAFRASLFDDLNISGALAALFDLVRDGNKALDAKAVEPGAAAAVVGLYEEMDGALGFLKPPAAEIPADVQALLEQRQAARTAKNWAESDRLRDVLAKKGWAVQDTAQGAKLKKL